MTYLVHTAHLHFAGPTACFMIGSWPGGFVTLTFSFATLFPLYLIAKRFFDRSTTLLVMLVFAFIPALVGRSADIIRGPIFWFFLSMGMYLFIRSGGKHPPTTL